VRKERRGKRGEKREEIGEKKPIGRL